MIYNGVNAQAFDYAVDAGEVKRRYAIGPLDPTVLFVGRMVVQKGPDILVRTHAARCCATTPTPSSSSPATGT